jgi:hypothetical protein
MTYQDAVVTAFIQLRAVSAVNASTGKPPYTALTTFQCEKEAHRIALNLKGAGYLERMSNLDKEMELSDVPEWRKRNGIHGFVSDEQWESV